MNKPELKITPIADVPHPIRGGYEWPICVCSGGVSTTIRARYDGVGGTGILTLSHFPQTAVLIEYDRD